MFANDKAVGWLKFKDHIGFSTVAINDDHIEIFSLKDFIVYNNFILPNGFASFKDSIHMLRLYDEMDFFTRTIEAIEQGFLINEVVNKHFPKHKIRKTKQNIETFKNRLIALAKETFEKAEKFRPLVENTGKVYLSFQAFNIKTKMITNYNKLIPIIGEDGRLNLDVTEKNASNFIVSEKVISIGTSKVSPKLTEHNAAASVIMMTSDTIEEVIDRIGQSGLFKMPMFYSFDEFQKVCKDLMEEYTTDLNKLIVNVYFKENITIACKELKP